MMPTCLLQLLCHNSSWLLQLQQNVCACMPALIAAANSGPALMLPTCLVGYSAISNRLLQLHLCLGSKPLRLVRLALRLLQLLLVLQLLVLQQLLVLLLQVQLLLQLLLLFWLQRPRTLAAAAPLWLWAPAAPSRCCC